MDTSILSKIISSLTRKKAPEAFYFKPLKLMVTLWPSFEHFSTFAYDNRLFGIRLNSAMINNPELDKALVDIKRFGPTVPLYFDAKARQPRIAWVDNTGKDHLEMRLNHPIAVKTPTTVLFKAGADSAELSHLEENGKMLIFKNGPDFQVHPGESIHILDDSFEIKGPLFTDTEKEKLEKVRKAGFKNYFLSYVECEKDIDEFRELVGKDSKIMLKIESRRGMNFVANEFKKSDNLVLVAARGDLYIELKWKHQIIRALELIIKKDPDACVASRLLLSVVSKHRNKKIYDALNLIRSEKFKSADTERKIEGTLMSLISYDFPSASDFCEIAWLYDLGYRNMMLCDELCLYEYLLNTAVGAFDAFRDDREEKYKIKTP